MSAEILGYALSTDHGTGRDRHARQAGVPTQFMDDATAESDGDSDTETETEAKANGITARYDETDAERLLEFDAEDRTAVVAQNREGYAMLTVRRTADGDELERYYGFDMALNHAAELLGVHPHDLPVPERAADMGM